MEILKIGHDSVKTLIIEPTVWFEANENLKNAVKRNKEEHKHFFKNQKVWSVPILDPRFVESTMWMGANGKVRKQLLAFFKGFDLNMKEFYRLAEVALCYSLHICA